MSAARFIKISDFCQTGSGTTPSRQKEARYYGGKIPWVKSGELREGEITVTEETVTEEALKETSLKLVPSGALLVAMYGATVGRVGRLGIEATTNQAVCHVVPDPALADERYMFHALCAKASELVAKGVGGAQPNISQGTIKDTQIYLPPLGEQQRIAAILDQADELRRKRQRAIDRLNQLGQAIFHEMFGDPQLGYDNVRLEDVASQIDYGLTASAKEDGDGPKFLRITDIQDGKVDWATVPLCDATTKQIADNELHVGDIVFARTGATTGKSFLIESCPDKAVFASYLIRVRPSKAVRPEYLFGFFQTTLYWNQIQSMAQGAAQPGVNSTKLKELVLPLPPIELQKKFCDAYREIKNQLVPMYDELAAYGRLFSSLQHRAFQGEL